MTKLTQPELIQIPMSRLLKIELPRFAGRFIEVVESHNPEELKIKELFDLLVAETPSINKLTDRYGPHPLTKKLRELKKDRTLRISEIRLRLKVVVREAKSGTAKDVEVLNNELNHFFQNLELSRNEEMFSQKITQFLTAVDSNLELYTALESLSFIPLIDNLKLVHSDIQLVIHDRMVSLSERTQESTEELKAVVLTATKSLIKHIEISPLINPDIDYAPLFNKLNQLLTEYKVMINRRVLSNKKKAEENDNNQSSQPAVTALIEDSAETMFYLDAEKVNGDEQEVDQVKTEPVQNEKAAALSSKTMQLPVVYDNGTLKK